MPAALDAGKVTIKGGWYQCPIIQGRVPGEILGVTASALNDLRGEQQPQAAGCRPAERCGAFALRSFRA